MYKVFSFRLENNYNNIDKYCRYLLKKVLLFFVNSKQGHMGLSTMGNWPLLIHQLLIIMVLYLIIIC